MIPIFNVNQSSKSAINSKLTTSISNAETDTCFDQDNYTIVTQVNNSSINRVTSGAINRANGGRGEDREDREDRRDRGDRGDRGDRETNSSGNTTTTIKDEYEYENNGSLRICKYFSRNECGFRRNKFCKMGYHMSEEKKNENQRVKICYSYINSKYNHSIQNCIQINKGLCEHCAYGDCINKNQCEFRHDPNVRYRNWNDSIATQYLLCNDWNSNIWCNGKKCNAQHLNQCPIEHQLHKNISSEFKTCSSECNKGYHQGPKPSRPTIPNIPLCIEIIEDIPTYKWGSKPTPPIFIKKVKPIDTEPKYFFDNEGYQCIDLHTSTPLSSSSIDKKSFTTNNITNTTKKSKSNNAKENLSIEDIEFFDNSLKNTDSNLSGFEINKIELKNKKLNAKCKKKALKLKEIASINTDTNTNIIDSDSEIKNKFLKTGNHNKFKDKKLSNKKSITKSLKGALTITSDSDSDSDSDCNNNSGIKNKFFK